MQPSFIVRTPSLSCISCALLYYFSIGFSQQQIILHEGQWHDILENLLLLLIIWIDQALDTVVAMDAAEVCWKLSAREPIVRTSCCCAYVPMIPPKLCFFQPNLLPLQLWCMTQEKSWYFKPPYTQTSYVAFIIMWGHFLFLVACPHPTVTHF